MNVPAVRRAALSTALAAILLVVGACSLLPSPDQVGIPVPIAVSSPQLKGEEPAPDRPVWLVTFVTAGEGPASTGGEISQVVVDGIDGRVIAIAQVFS